MTMPRGLLAGWVGVLWLCSAPSARAWEVAETHAGLTEEAVSASKLHSVLAHKLGRDLGLWETLRLPASVADSDEGRRFFDRLRALDASGGYRPNKDGGQSALAWVVAGTVLEKTPPERGRHHFLDPRTGKGLDDAAGLSGSLHALSLSFDEGTTSRDLATGQSFDLRGKSSLEWLRSNLNDLSLPVFFAQYELSATLRTKPERELALVRALLALGSVLCLVEDAGHPAFSRNDMRGEFLGEGDGSALDSYVRNRMGRVALPKSSAAAVRPTLDSYFIAADGKGLSQIAGLGFFSTGTLPADVPVSGRSLDRISSDANASLHFPSPMVNGLRFPGEGKLGYVWKDGHRVASYRRIGDSLRFGFDDKVFEDSAKVLLPLVLSYAAGVVNQLFRGELEITVQSGKAEVRLKGLTGIKGEGRATVLFEDEQGVRTAQPAVALDGSLSAVVPVPAGSRKLAVAWRGEDAAGEVVVVSEVSLP